MKQTFILFIVLTLILPAYSKESKRGLSMFDELQMSLDPEFSSPIMQQSCPAPKVRMLGSSQSSLVHFFKNLSCDSASKEILGESLTSYQCRSVNDCQAQQRKISPITSEENKFIRNQVMDFILRENVHSELTKYQAAESKNLKDLVTFADKMPDEFKKQIHFCPNYNFNPEKCLNEAELDNAAKNYIAGFSSQDEPARFKSAFRSLDANEDFKKILLDPEMKPWVTRVNQRYETQRSQMILDSRKEKRSGSDDFKRLMNLDQSRSDDIREGSVDFSPDNDLLLNEIIKSVVHDVGKISQNELKERVKSVVLKFSLNDRDLILSHPSKSVKNSIEKAFESMTFDSDDIVKSDRKSLSKKMNELRVQVANRILDEECKQRIVSMGQMCAKISDNMKSGKAGVKSLNDADIFAKMLASFKKMKGNDKNFDQIIAEFQRMGEAKDKVYNRYINLMFNTTICKEKHPGTILNSSEDDEAVGDYQKSTEAFAQQTKEDASNDIAKMIERDDNLRQKLAQSGFNFTALKADYPNLDLHQAKSESSLPNIETATSPLKTLTNEIQPVMNTNIVQNQHSVRNFDVSNSDSSADEARKNADKYFGEEALTERIKALEKKESSLRKKITSSNTEDIQDVGANNELSTLRRQIEELKNQRGGAATAASAESTSVSNDKVEGQNAARFTGNSDRVKSRVIASETDSIDSLRAEMAQARVQANPGSADYQPDAQAAAGAARSPASSGNQAATGVKGGTEKNMAGLTLTKGGDGALDSSSILDNPNEGDIALFMERTHGEPFIIRENGELIKVSPVLDANGKLVLTSNGKIKFKKIKLSKAQQELIAKEANVNKAAKEVGVEPVRLFNLKSLLKEVRRN